MKTACERCGAEVDDTATFCPECGGRLGVPFAPTPLRKRKRESKWKGPFLIVVGIGFVVLSVYDWVLASYLGEPPTLEDIFYIVIGIALMAWGFIKASRK